MNPTLSILLCYSVIISSYCLYQQSTYAHANEIALIQSSTSQFQKEVQNQIQDLIHRIQTNSQQEKSDDNLTSNQDAIHSQKSESFCGNTMEGDKITVDLAPLVSQQQIQLDHLSTEYNKTAKQNEEHFVSLQNNHNKLFKALDEMKNNFAVQSQHIMGFNSSNTVFKSKVEFNLTKIQREVNQTQDKVNTFNMKMASQSQNFQAQSLAITTFKTAIGEIIQILSDQNKSLTDLKSNQDGILHNIKQLQQQQTVLKSYGPYQIDTWEWQATLSYAEMNFFPSLAKITIKQKSNVILTFNGSTQTTHFCFLTFTKDRQPLYPQKQANKVLQENSFFVAPSKEYPLPSNFVQDIIVEAGVFDFELGVICDGQPTSDFKLLGSAFTVQVQEIQ